MIKNIFPIPLYETFVEPDMVDLLENKVCNLLPLLFTNSEHNSNFYDTSKSIRLMEKLPEFFELAKDQSTSMIRDSNIIISENTMLTISAWIQDYQLKQFHSIHNHPRSLLSGVYFVRADQGAPPLILYNPNPGQIMVSDNENDKMYEVEPERGKMVIFPSYLFHEVLSNDNNHNRTVLAFNLL